MISYPDQMNVQHAITAEQVAMEAIIVAEERAEQAEGLAKSYRDALRKGKESLVDSKSVATCDNLMWVKQQMH